jgi:exonuclease III
MTNLDRINKALELAEGGFFASKADQKEAMRLLNTVYSSIRTAYHSKMWNEFWEDFTLSGTEPTFEQRNKMSEKTDFPYDLHQVREAKHADMFGSVWAGIKEIADLRAEFKDMEVSPKQASEKALIAQEERETAKQVKDSGFRANVNFSNSWYDCVSVLGNHFIRVVWYRMGSRVSYASVRAELAPMIEFWESKGQPNMKDWSLDQIDNFYKENKVAA